MKKKLQLSLIFAVSLGISSLALAEKPGPDAEALWQYIQETSPYSTWGFWPDHQELQEGNAPHAPLHKVYVNDIGLSSAHAPVDDGSIIVKENIGNDKELKALTVMYKLKEYNSEAGDWYWVKYGADGSVAKAANRRTVSVVTAVPSTAIISWYAALTKGYLEKRRVTLYHPTVISKHYATLYRRHERESDYSADPGSRVSAPCG